MEKKHELKNDDKHADEKHKDKWHSHRHCPVGVNSSEATVVTRTSSYTLLVLMPTSSNMAVQLPLTHVSTEVVAGSTAPVSPAAVVGDVVEVCVEPDSLASAYVWYGVTADSAGGHYEQVEPGKCRVYRYVSGAVWNRYS